MRLVHKRLGLPLAIFSASLTALVPAATLTLCPGHAHAAPPGQTPAQQRAYARELYTNGQQLFRQGDFPGAQRSFEEAYKVAPNPVVLLSIAECQVRTEQFTAAIDSLRTYLKERPTAPDKPQVEAQIEVLLAKPATLTVQSSVDGASIAVDGNATGRVTPTDLELTAGDHNIALQLDGYVPNEQSVTLSPGGKDAVRITLMPAKAEAAPIVAEPVSSEPSEAKSKRHATKAVWIATGVAGAGLVTGAILGGVAVAKKNEFDDKPSESLADQGERLALFADVGFGIAAAAGITALVLYLTSNKSEDVPQPQAFSVQPVLSAQRAGVAGQLRF